MKPEDVRYLLLDRDRHGNARLYARKHGRRIRIRAAFDTPAFHIEFGQALEALDRPPEPAKRTRPLQAKPGSLQWLVDQYTANCTDFLTMEPDGQRVRRNRLQAVCDEEVKLGAGGPTLGEMSYQHIKAEHVAKLKNRHVAEPEGANNRIKALRQLYRWAIEAKHATHSPAKEVPYFKVASEGFHTWTIGEVRQYMDRHAPGTKARRALMLALLTGGRRSDLVRLGKQMLRDGWLRWIEKKGSRQKVKVTEIPVLPALQAELDLAPADEMTFLVSERGRPFSAASFGNWFRKRCDEAGLKHCSAHGLRKAGATFAAEAGATVYQLMAIYGWTTEKQAANYVKKANRKRLAGDAMHLLDRTDEKPIVPPSGVVPKVGQNRRSKSL